MPNSKSWLKSSVELTDASRRVKTLSFDTPFALGASPGCGTSYRHRHLRRVSRGDRRRGVHASRCRRGHARRPRNGVEQPGTCRTRRKDNCGPEVSVAAAGRSPVASGWGHFRALCSWSRSVFRTGKTAGTYVVSLNGQGQASRQFSPQGTATLHRFGIYQHFVTTPVPIGRDQSGVDGQRADSDSATIKTCPCTVHSAQTAKRRVRTSLKLLASDAASSRPPPPTSDSRRA
jgi:hypothetical protein